MIPDAHQLFSRQQWATMSNRQPRHVAEGLKPREAGASMTMAEHDDVLGPLACMIARHRARRRWPQTRTRDVGLAPERPPYLIAVAGGVASGKSTFSKRLSTVLSKGDASPVVALVSTDGFLLSRTQLLARGLMLRKGFPETYDAARLTQFLEDLRQGRPTRAPLYSHEIYDVLPGAGEMIDRPDMVVVEGLNVLQVGPTYGDSEPEERRVFDLTIYLDADEREAERWYVERFLALKRQALENRDSHFHELGRISDDEARMFARKVWAKVNRPNLLEHILPTRSLADIVVRKGVDHAVDGLWIRRSALS